MYMDACMQGMYVYIYMLYECLHLDMYIVDI